MPHSPTKLAFVAGPLRRARLRLRVLLAAASIHGMKPGDITPDGLAYTVQKGGHSGQTISRSMHSTIWQAYVDLLRELPEDDDRLFRDTSWLYRGVRRIMAEAGIPLQSNRLGTHVFRRVWVEWCESNDVGIEIASQGLNHVDSQVTERVYCDVIKGQMRASAAMARYAEDVLNPSSMREETMQELSELNSLLSHVFAYGLPLGQENDPHSVGWSQDASAEDEWWVRPDLNCNPGGVRQRLSTLIDKGLHDLKRGRTDRAIGLLTAIHDGMRSHAEHSSKQGAAGGEA